ncbi:DUF1217 domain-containing protein [Rhizobium sp. CG5]|uniref:DUF1217 domain-containing protein n=1 Tax=Rhizobium sp. CG5 TaxID=2726076 RepID=UPI0020339593|nr:DUF1217 domain-containing protein [Rhizobium sp. CG5]MCM2476852.1 DUF1217 domain-containing protein [Rhizobium sp. CG5]
MVSTYLSYDLVARDTKASLERVATSSQVQRDAAYYKENIGKVTTVDEFLDDYQLYSYAMKAHGLEEMTYAKAFMKKVLESDLSDENSYANKLSDDRYRTFATAFTFSTATTDAQSDSQEDEMIGLYKQALTDESTEIEAEIAYYDEAVDNVQTVSDLLDNSRLRNFVLDAFELDSTYYSVDFLTSVLTSDVSDPASFVNQAGNEDYVSLASAFSFNADGTISGTTAQTAAQKTSVEDLYLEVVPSYTIPYVAEREKAYYESKIGTITNVDELTNDSRLFNYVKTAFQMPASTLKATFSNIVTSDLTDPNNYAMQQGGSAYTSIAAMFNFETDGTVAAGSAQSATQLERTNTGYLSHYDDADQEDLDDLVDYYSTQMGTVETVDDLLGNTKMYAMLLKAYDLEDGEVSKANLRRVLTSDLTDPKSYANKSKDERLISMASAFNFSSEGDATAPLLAQSQIAITDIAKSYIVNKTRLLEDPELTTAKTAATEESTYYQETVIGIRTVEELLEDPRLVDFLLVSKGLDPEEVDDDFMEQLFASDLEDPDSFANSQADERYAEIVASFNFDSEGNLTSDTVGTVQQRGAVLETQNLYLHQTMEEEQGESNNGVRLALYWERMAPTINSAYDILGDTALLETFRTAFGYTSDFSSLDIDKQAALVEKNLDLEELQDPDKVKKFLQRFTSMYDIDNVDTTSGALSVLSGNGSGGISADLLLSISQLKSG